MYNMILYVTKGVIIIEEIPTFSEDLIKRLDKLYPERSPNPKDSEREVWMKAGKRELVRTLVQSQKQLEGEGLKEELVG